MSDRSPTSPQSSPWCVVALALSLGVVAGCGYTTRDVYPADVRSVAVPIFENRTFYRGIERDLTEALIKEIELRTPYKATRGGVADTELSGIVLKVEQDLLSRRRPGNLPEQLEVAIVVDFEWRNQRTGQTLTSRKGFEAVSRYRPTQPLGEPFELAQHDAVQRMAAQIVASMRADW